MDRSGRTLLQLVLPAFLLPISGRAPAQTPTLSVALRPAAPDTSGRVPAVDVTISFSQDAVKAGQALLRMPLVTSNVETVAKTLEGLTAEDTKGPLILTSVDGPEAQDTSYRYWSASRETSGLVRVYYRAPITQVLAPRGAAPPLELRSDTGAFSGQGKTFLMLPETNLPWKLNVTWDLSRMPAGASGVSTFGKGDATPAATGSEALGSSFFMAGVVHLYPEAPPSAGFSSAWYGTPPFALQPVMMSEQKLFDFYVHFFQAPRTAPYFVFMRENLVNAGGGVSLGGNAFVTTFGPKTELDEVKITLAHEMLHTFVGGLDKTDESDSWYSEGLAVYYARLLALRAGQITPGQFLTDLNLTAGRYYTDALIHTPNSQIAANFWADTRIRVLPYDRGSMYFAVLDGEIRQHSGGKRSLDDLVLAMLARKKQGLAMDKAAWIALVTAELGEEGMTEFQAMLNGAIQLPEPNGFGPCFTRVSKPMRRYQLGFEPRVLIEHKRVIRGLIPGSAADLAGVRDGDEITKPVPQDLLQGEQEGILTLQLLRDGKPLTISYKPRGETVDAYQWVRQANVSDSQCSY